MLMKSIQADINVSYERYNLYQELDRALEHWFVGPAVDLYANVACLTGGTKIPLLNGEEVTIDSLVDRHSRGEDIWLYSCDYSGRPQPAKLLNAVKQKHTPVTFRIHLDNGKYVEASGDHRFIRRDGTICRADELVVGESLMPFHRSLDPKGYERVWDVEKANWRSTYKVVAGYLADVDLEEVNKGKDIRTHRSDYLVVHHVDFDKTNNNPNNLQLMSCKEHLKLHSSSLKQRWENSKWREMMIQKNIASHRTASYLKGLQQRMRNWWNSPDGQKQRRKHSQMFTGRDVTDEHRENNRRAQLGKTLTEEHRRRISEGLYRAVREGRKKAQKTTKICPVCGSQFKVSPSRSQAVCCCRTCADIRRRVPREKRTCMFCGGVFLCKVNDTQRFCSPACGNKFRAHPEEERICACGCGETFRCKESSLQRFIHHHHTRVPHVFPSNNHKVVKIEVIGEQVVYDISVSGSQLFGLSAGIYIHNSTYSPMHNATVWITSDSEKIQHIARCITQQYGSHLIQRRSSKS